MLGRRRCGMRARRAVVRGGVEAAHDPLPIDGRVVRLVVEVVQRPIVLRRGLDDLADGAEREIDARIAAEVRDVGEVVEDLENHPPRARAHRRVARGREAPGGAGAGVRDLNGEQRSNRPRCRVRDAHHMVVAGVLRCDPVSNEVRGELLA
ncbi:MAG TPA: hypothetical protein VGM56_21365 [Byssovorax sp.]